MIRLSQACHYPEVYLLMRRHPPTQHPPTPPALSARLTPGTTTCLHPLLHTAHHRTDTDGCPRSHIRGHHAVFLAQHSDSHHEYTRTHVDIVHR